MKGGRKLKWPKLFFHFYIINRKKLHFAFVFVFVFVFVFFLFSAVWKSRDYIAGSLPSSSLCWANLSRYLLVSPYKERNYDKKYHCSLICSLYIHTHTHTYIYMCVCVYFMLNYHPFNYIYYFWNSIL